MFIKLIGEEQIEDCHPVYYRELDSNQKFINDEVNIFIHMKDKPYSLRCEYIFNKPVFVAIQVYYKDKYIAHIGICLYGIKKYFKHAFNDLKKKIKNGKRPSEKNKVFYYLVDKNHFSFYDNDEFNDI